MTTGEHSFSADVFDGKATVLGGVEIAGMSHISVSEIDRFETDKIGSSGGKFGVGTYFALGNLKGETADDLVGRYESGDAVKHEAKAAGNFLVVDRKNVLALNDDIRKVLGEPEPGFKSSIRNAPQLTTKLQAFQVNVQPIDGVIILMSDEDPSAEVIIMPGSTPKIEVERRSRSTDVPIKPASASSRIRYKGRGTTSRVLGDSH